MVIIVPTQVPNKFHFLESITSAIHKFVYLYKHTNSYRLVTSELCWCVTSNILLQKMNFMALMNSQNMFLQIFHHPNLMKTWEKEAIGLISNYVMAWILMLWDIWAIKWMKNNPEISLEKIMGCSSSENALLNS